MVFDNYIPTQVISLEWKPFQTSIIKNIIISILIIWWLKNII